MLHRLAHSRTCWLLERCAQKAGRALPALLRAPPCRRRVPSPTHPHTHTTTITHTLLFPRFPSLSHSQPQLLTRPASSLTSAAMADRPFLSASFTMGTIRPMGVCGKHGYQTRRQGWMSRAGVPGNRAHPAPQGSPTQLALPASPARCQVAARVLACTSASACMQAGRSVRRSHLHRNAAVHVVVLADVLWVPAGVDLGHLAQCQRGGLQAGLHRDLRSYSWLVNGTKHGTRLHSKRR